MAYYAVEFKTKAVKELNKLPGKAVYKISVEIEQLAFNPYPTGCKKLAGSEHSYRIRIGDYRVIYMVFDDKLVIQVIKIGHRKDIYQ
jgi:mRNA interferase RelE/StbE